MIKNLDVDDETEFSGGVTGAMEKFSVQVADCFGATGSNVACQGELTKALKLRISAAVSGSNVKWEKEGGKLPASSKKVGTNDVGLKLTALTPADAGTYKATYDGNTVSFAVRIPGLSGNGESDTKKESTENGKDNSGGGGSSNSGTDQVNLGEGKGTGAGDHGGVGGLSYSPALLVTVTLVHLLLQLAD
ncbi:S-layer-related protein-like [Syngnathus acus]|uniref:S-layer-related protein-like n=1 Tax=Syngnathus acus TaxID=161584 RepID=UPI00188617E5|nr:S-layer-related protein-like [Syngnathus acus]